MDSIRQSQISKRSGNSKIGSSKRPSAFKTQIDNNLQKLELEERKHELEIKLDRPTFWQKHKYFIFTIIITLIETIVACALFSPFLASELNTGGSVVLILILMIEIVWFYTLAVICILINPSEAAAKRQESDSYQGKFYLLTTVLNVIQVQFIYFLILCLEKEIFECKICKLRVGKNTKHWYEWDIWIKDFDHHCSWLNKWIGYNNYRVFIALISIYWLYNFTFLPINLSVIIVMPRTDFWDSW